MLRRCILALAMFPVCAGTGSATDLDPAAVYGELAAPQLDGSLAFTIKDLTLERGAAKLKLAQGIVFPLRAGDADVGAVFEGTGRFVFVPPAGVEADQLEKFTKKRALDEPFVEVLILATDATLAELRAASPGAAADANAARAQRYVEERFEHHLKKRRWNPAARLLADVVEGTHGFFLAEPDTVGQGTLSFSYDLRDDEPQALSHWSNRYSGFDDLWCSFGPAGPGPRVTVAHYDIAVRLEGDKLVDETVTATLKQRLEGARVLSFGLHPLMEVVAVTGRDGAPLFFAHDKSESKLWEHAVTVVFPAPVEDGDTVQFKLKGDIVDGLGSGAFAIKATEDWYPTLGYLERATFKLRFDTNAKHKVYASARKLDDRVEGDRRITTWEQSFPVALMAFNYGDMPVEEVKIEGHVPVTVFGREEGLVIGDQLKNVGIDVSNSVAIFSKVFGEYPFETLYATWIPYRHGQGFPGLLHLSSLTFGGEHKGSSESFRAHEVSHQWWGHLVGWKTYRDQWISEGFANYSGALYTLVYTKDEALFYRTLEAQAHALIHPKPPNQGAAAGPLTLGWRLSSSESPADYGTVVYQKGAWVLHMLRMLMRDFKTGADTDFNATLQDFVATYRGQSATTADFRRVVEKHTGKDMGWFFDEWVEGTAIPRYTWAWKQDKKDGKDEVVVRVRQKLPGDRPFKMIVPVRLEFGKDRWAVVKLPVDQAERVYELPVPMKVVDVVFNAADSVLCDADEEGF